MKRTTIRAIYRAIIETLETRRLFTLAAPVSYPVPANPSAVVTGDVNGDSRSDVITANAATNTISVRLSNADGTLQAAQNFATGISPNSVAVGDVNNDGKRDLVTGNGGGDLSVLLGNGNGTFQPALTSTLPPQFPPGYPGADPLAQSPSSVAVGDLNGDGKLDLVVGAQVSWRQLYTGYYGQYYRYYSQPYVDVLIGNGNGTFGTATATRDSYGATSIGIADFNGDSKLDVLFGPYAEVLLGNGDGTLQPPLNSNGVWSREWAIGDFNNDGKLDLAGGSGTIYLLKGQGNGTFQSAVAIADGQVRSVVAGDVNADGKLDLVVSTQQTTFEYYGYYGGYNPTTTDYTKVLLGYGDGTFALPHTSTLDSHADYGTPNVSSVGDFNGDARLDLVATDPHNNALYVQLNQNDWVLPGTLGISDVTVTEGHAGTVNAVFTVTLGAAPAANVTVNYATADGTATLEGGDYVETSGSLTFTPGQTTKTITVQVKGDRIGESDETFNVNLTNAVNADVLDGTGIGTITDDEPRVSIGNASLTEGNTGTTPMTFTVTLSAASDVASTVNYSTGIYGSAVSGKDFDATSGTVTFLAGQTSKTLSVAVRGDLIDEFDETFTVELSGATNAVTLNGSGTGTIIDNDAPASIVVSDVSRSEGDSGTRQFEFRVSLLSPSEKTVSVQYATANGTATSSTSGHKQDYLPASSSVTLSPGQQSATVTVAVVGDTRNESDETFFLNLSSPTNATLADAQGVGTILNDEGGRGKTWIGPASGGSWGTAANWSPSGVPVSDSLVSISGAAVTLSANATVAEIDLSGGSLTVAAAGNRVLRTARLYVEGNSKLNLIDNSLILDYAGGTPSGEAYANVAGLIQSGFNGGGWNGANGIVTSAPQAAAGLTALGSAEAADLLGITGGQLASWRGQTVDATAVLVRNTYYGDADLNGTVTLDDFTLFLHGYQTGGTRWLDGDFDLNGQTTLDDFTLFLSGYQKQGAPL